MSGFLNLIGMGGAIMINYDLVKRSEVLKQQSKPGDGDILSAICHDFLKWFLSDGADAHYVKSAGAIFLLAAPYFWAYSFASFLLFLKDPEPVCGPADRDNVFQR